MTGRKGFCNVPWPVSALVRNVATPIFAKKVVLRMTTQTYANMLLEDPNGFLRKTEVWCIPGGVNGEPGEAIVRAYDENALHRAYPENATFISKIVLAKGPKDEKLLFLATTGLLDVVHLIEVLRNMDFGKVKFGIMEHTKAEFAAPAVRKYAFLLTFKDDEKNEVKAEALHPTDLVDVHGRKIMFERNGNDEADWVYNWNFVQTQNGIHVVALTAGGKIYRLMNPNRRYMNVTPKGIEFVNDVITIPRPGQEEPEYVIATRNGIIYRDRIIPGTPGYDVARLCYDSDQQILWALTRGNKVYRMWLEGGRFLHPETWSNVPALFEEAVSHKILCGSEVPNPILSAWSRPKEIMTKDPVTEADKGTGKFTVTYFRMELPKMVKSVADDSPALSQ